ncbi:MFS transporter [Fodinicola feengrottensis]|uniref:MFS transporter n=1 Tax=Fodinicola feengrottensis TaxID=435914 RepID=UPI0013CFB18E|nr:MFS transporter [Fodinicola feengrottensis]
MTAATGAETDQRPGLPKRFSASVALGTLLQPLNSSMIAVALVQIGVAFHVPAGSQTQWLVSGLYLATAVSAPTAGKLADLFGARKVFLTGLALVAVVSLLAPFSPSLGWLIAARVLLGIGTGAQFPAGVAMIRRIADQRKASAVGALGILSIFAQTSAALGPSLGGVLVGGFGWESIFFVNIPMTLAAAICVLRMVPPDVPREIGGWRQVVREIEPARADHLQCRDDGLDADSAVAGRPATVGAVGGRRAGLRGLRVVGERRAATPFVDVRLLVRSKALSLTYVRTLLTYTAFYAIFYGLPGWLEQARHLTRPRSVWWCCRSRPWAR